jgi:nucleotide-binding universal stress UspA family protein
MKRFKKILYVHDYDSPYSAETLQLAAQLAERNGGEVHLTTVIEPPPAIFASNTSILLRSQLLDQAQADLTKLAQTHKSTEKATVYVLEGRAYIEIIRQVLKQGYDLVVKPTGGSGIVDRLLGRLDMKLLRHCPCPVWLSKGETYGEFDHVLAAVDTDEDVIEDRSRHEEDSREELNRQILEISSALCTDSDATLHVGHVWDAPFLSKYSRARANIPKKEIEAYISSVERDHTNWLRRLMTRAKNWLGEELLKQVKVRKHLRQGDAGELIPNLIAEIQADLIVMGTVARTGIPGLIIGNTAEEILDQVTCSVLAVKPPGFVSPVTIDS